MGRQEEINSIGLNIGWHQRSRPKINPLLLINIMAPFLAGMSAYQDCYEQRCHYLLILTAFILAKIDLPYDPLYCEA